MLCKRTRGGHKCRGNFQRSWGRPGPSIEITGALTHCFLHLRTTQYFFLSSYSAWQPPQPPLQQLPPPQQPQQPNPLSFPSHYLGTKPRRSICWYFFWWILTRSKQTKNAAVRQTTNSKVFKCATGDWPVARPPPSRYGAFFLPSTNLSCSLFPCSCSVSKIGYISV